MRRRIFEIIEQGLDQLIFRGMTEIGNGRDQTEVGIVKRIALQQEVMPFLLHEADLLLKTETFFGGTIVAEGTGFVMEQFGKRSPDDLISL